MPSRLDSVNPAMTTDDRIDNKRNLCLLPSDRRSNRGRRCSGCCASLRACSWRWWRSRRSSLPAAGSAAAPGARRATPCGAGGAVSASARAVTLRVVVHRVAARVSLRSRERKLRLFLELFRPGPETTVVDVGVTDAPFGGGSTRQLLRGALSVAGADHRRSATRSSTASRPRFPRVTAVRADGRELPFADGAFDLGFSNAVVEHVAGGRAGAAAVRRRALPRRAARVRDDAEPLASRSIRTRCCRSSTGCPDGGPRRRLLRARGFDDVLDPLGPEGARRALSLPGARSSAAG